MIKYIQAKDLEYIPASHEDPTNPGSLKKVLVQKSDLMEGRVQMINWSLLRAGRSFAQHYHEDMDEIFIILSGSARIVIDGEEAILTPETAVIIPAMAVHQMFNQSDIDDVHYIAIGVAGNKNGKTVIV